MTTRPHPSDTRDIVATGRGWLWILTALIAVIAVGAWISLAVGLWLDFERPLLFILAFAAAISTEVLFWTAAAALGVSVLSMRRRLWGWIVGR